MNLANWLAQRARLAPATPALLKGTAIEADYATFAQRVSALAGAFSRHHGIGPGMRVGIFMTNRTAYLEALVAIWWAGGAAVPVNAKLTGEEAAGILSDADARLTVTAGQEGEALAAARPGHRLLDADGLDWERAASAHTHALATPAPRTPDDLAWLFYTSGTTGRPKGVMLTHGNLLAATLCYPVDVDPVASADCALYAAPMSHGAGLYSLIHLRAGARHAVPESGGFDPTEILELAPRLGRVSFFAAPTMVRRLVAAARATRSTGDGIRTVVYGGGPMYLADIEEAVRIMGPRFVQIYGQGESPMTITALSRDLVADRTHPRWRERLGSVGTAQSCVELAIADEAGRHLPPGETGEILVRGPQVMAGYWQNPQASAEALRSGWLWTGDIGRLDDDGFLTLTDRSKDVIISGGTNIYPREIEEVLLSHPAIAETAVVGRPHPDWGEEVVAFVVAEDGAPAPDPAALDAFCRTRMARFKRPRHYEIVSGLPKNNYGKVVKTELRARLG